MEHGGHSINIGGILTRPRLFSGIPGERRPGWDPPVWQTVPSCVTKELSVSQFERGAWAAFSFLFRLVMTMPSAARPGPTWSSEDVEPWNKGDFSVLLRLFPQTFSCLCLESWSVWIDAHRCTLRVDEVTVMGDINRCVKQRESKAGIWVFSLFSGTEVLPWSWAASTSTNSAPG